MVDDQTKTIEDVVELDDPFDDPQTEYVYAADDLDLPPLRIGATKNTHRLHGSMGALQTSGLLSASSSQPSPCVRRRSHSDVNPRSRSRSPSLNKETVTTFDGNSSISSMEDLAIDHDILTDKMGLVELDLKEQQVSSASLHNSFSNLPPVSERLSEDTLEDCHAFCDIRQPHSRGNSIATGGDVGSSLQLEPLDECDDEDAADDNGHEVILLTNMENLTILEAEENEADDAAPDTGDVSLPTT